MIMVKHMVPMVESNLYSFHDYRQQIPMIMVSIIIGFDLLISNFYIDHYYVNSSWNIACLKSNFPFLIYFTCVYIMMKNH